MATRTGCSPGRIYIPRWVQLAVLPALLIIGWFILGAIGQVIFVFLVAGGEVDGNTSMPIAIPLIPLAEET